MEWRNILKPSDKTAEERFREAFERLKVGEPKVLQFGACVSQNNVAREAGCDQSALRKSRFPALIAEIQRYVDSCEQRPPSKRQQMLAQRTKNRNARETISDLRTQHDKVVGLLADANGRIVELTRMLADRDAQLASLMSCSKVTSLPRRFAKDIVSVKNVPTSEK